jgi:hypothetical protein
MSIAIEQECAPAVQSAALRWGCSASRSRSRSSPLRRQPAGGILVDTVGWRGVCFVNLPLCLVLALVGTRLLPADSTAAGPRRLDLPGTARVTAATAVLVYAPTLGTNDGWSSWSFVGCPLASALFFGAFVVVEERSRQPSCLWGSFRHARSSSATC